MKLTFLGTSAGVPVAGRNVTAQVVSFAHGPLWLLDCGEATQHQLQRSGLRAAKIERVLLTHLHGDHCLGLPGLLMAVAIAGRKDPVQVCGPPGVRELLATVLRVTDAHLPFRLDVVEIDPLAASVEVPLPESADRHTWSALPILISHRVTCFAWLLTEPLRRGIFHAKRADELGVPPGPDRRRLQDGAAVTLADGRVVQPGDVADPPRAGRRVLLLGDTDDADACLMHAKGCDLAVREVTYESGMEDKARAWGHSTAAMSGEWAAALGCRTLIITHFSARYTVPGQDGGGDVAGLVVQTLAAAPGVEVLAAEDLWTWTLP